MKLKVNREFLVRHLFAAGVFLVLGGWFGYDAFVKYPAMPAAELYTSIEGTAPEGKTEAQLESFKAQKMAMQRYFALIGIVAGLAVLLHLRGVTKLDFAFDEEGFTCDGVRRRYADIKEIDTTEWEKKGILRLKGENWRLALDGWHFSGVKEFYARLPQK